MPGPGRLRAGRAGYCMGDEEQQPSRGHAGRGAPPVEDRPPGIDIETDQDAMMAPRDHPVASEVRRRLDAERSRLLGLRDGLEQDRAAESESESAQELSSVDQHPADSGTEMFDRERDTSIAESLDGELAEVEAALGRLDDGSYGTCTACGRPIPAERLDALPATRFCVDDAAAASAEGAPGVVPTGPGGADVEAPGRAI